MSSRRTPGPITTDLICLSELGLQPGITTRAGGWVPAQGRDDELWMLGLRLLSLREAIIERVAGAADGADRVLLAARIE
jgi:hypothetical protein